MKSAGLEDVYERMTGDGDMIEPEEGGTCRHNDCSGVYELVKEDDRMGCSCHINPPCSTCVNMTIECTKCHDRPWEDEPDGQ
jgi:hypothetical protein